MPRVLIPLAQGCEELEAVTIIDLLRRAEIEVITAGLDTEPVKASRGTLLIPDTDLEAIKNEAFDMIVLPGGLPGADNLRDDIRIINILKRHSKKNKTLAAICAAPKVLAHAGLLKGHQATSFPRALDDIDLTEVNLSDAPVVIDGGIITSRSPGTAMDFSLALIESLSGRNKRERVEAALCRPA
ncbi:MAG: DJ-1 family protein [Thiothrix sp.]|nr:MAG: DJ-1 family protein [Thiothrix sp.]